MSHHFLKHFHLHHNTNQSHEKSGHGFFKLCRSKNERSLVNINTNIGSNNSNSNWDNTINSATAPSWKPNIWISNNTSSSNVASIPGSTMINNSISTTSHNSEDNDGGSPNSGSSDAFGYACDDWSLGF